MIRGFVCAAAVALAGCSGGFGTMDRIMSSWQGAPLDAVISQWGYPHQEQSIAGHKIYRWLYTKKFQLPSTTTGTLTPAGNGAILNTTTTGGGTLEGACVRTLEVDEHNTVIHWEWSGNNCPFADVPGFEYGNWQRKQ